MDLLPALRQYFGFEAFRPGPKEALHNLLAGRHTLVVMPTGAGKSLIYQLAACLLTDTTLVISPLIALMKDQVDGLTRRSISATAINSTIPSSEQARRLRGFVEGAYRLVYVAPERLRHHVFRRALSEARIGLLAVDEAHCISQWGHDFRPDYLHLAAARREIGEPTTAALTATATPHVQDDIVRHLGLPAAERIVTGFNRPNLTFRVHYTPDLPDKLRALREFLASNPGPGIIYVGTRREAEEVDDFIREVVRQEARAYHAGLEDTIRTTIQDAFMAGRLNLVVATNAFGMGVDRADVRFVLHFSLPGTLEAYYQEAGRAGRDGEPAECLLLYSPQDRALQEWFIENDAPSARELKAIYQAVHEAAHGDVAVLTLDDLALATGIGEVKLRVGLSLLEQMEALHRLGDEGRRLWLEVRPWPPERLTVVSGLALGIDTAAHKGALKTPGGRTLAVLGSGLEVIHPRENRALAERIATRGVLLSELRPETPPRGPYLMARDRIIAALSRAVIVVEAEEKSGSLDTARRAQRLGRLVLACPGSPGTDALLRAGAERLDPEAVDLDALAHLLRCPPEPPPVSKQQKLF